MSGLTRSALETAAADLVATAKEQGITLATAESLTGGMLGELICTVPGASAVYLGGVISYASSVKAGVLGVNPALLAERGAVDPDVAVQMATGTARVCAAEAGVATTGAAGPEPCDGKPVGTVYLAAVVGNRTVVEEKHYSGDRAEIRAQASYDALTLLAGVIAG